jgi:hypothetical protein
MKTKKNYFFLKKTIEKITENYKTIFLNKKQTIEKEKRKTSFLLNLKK